MHFVVNYSQLLILKYITRADDDDNDDDDDAVVRALAAHQCGPDSIPALRVCCWFSLSSKCFSPGSLVSLPSQNPTSPNSNSTIWLLL